MKMCLPKPPSSVILVLAAMKILSLNATFWPVIGGIESVMRQQAEALAKHGNQVLVLTGKGEVSHDSYILELLPELDPEFPLNLQVKKAVDHGQTDHHLQDYTNLLYDKLKPYFTECDIALVHGAFTTHFNLALTQACWRLAEQTPCLAWAHDFTPTNKDYSMPFQDRKPWALMNMQHPKVTYVAVSESRGQEIHQALKIPYDEIPYIPHGIDLALLKGFAPELKTWLEERKMFSRDMILYCPSKLLQRKNVDMAMMMLDAIRKEGIDAALLITGEMDLLTAARQQYQEYVLSMIGQLKLESDCFIMSQHFQPTDELWQELYAIAHVVLFPSRYEGFGLPAYEAAALGIEFWGTPLPSYMPLQSNRLKKVTNPQEAVDAAKEWMAQPDNIFRRRFLKEFSWDNIYLERMKPYFEAIIEAWNEPEE